MSLSKSENNFCLFDLQREKKDRLRKLKEPENVENCMAYSACLVFRVPFSIVTVDEQS